MRLPPWHSRLGTGNTVVMFPVSADKARALADRMRAVGFDERDLDETFVRAQGRGGQNVNKVSSCVLLRHRPTGILVKCQEERSQALNRFLARRRLCERLEALRRGAVEREQAERARIRRQKRRRSRRAKEKMLAAKHAHAAKKAERRRPATDE